LFSEKIYAETKNIFLFLLPARIGSHLIAYQKASKQAIIVRKFLELFKVSIE
jgi:hypothetical protein